MPLSLSDFVAQALARYGVSLDDVHRVASPAAMAGSRAIIATWPAKPWESDIRQFLELADAIPALEANPNILLEVTLAAGTANARDVIVGFDTSVNDWVIVTDRILAPTEDDLRLPP